jgi:hypothetical protein
MVGQFCSDCSLLLKSSHPYLCSNALGILEGIRTDPDNVVHMKRIAEMLFGDSYTGRFWVQAAPDAADHIGMR